MVPRVKNRLLAAKIDLNEGIFMTTTLTPVRPDATRKEPLARPGPDFEFALKRVVSTLSTDLREMVAHQLGWEDPLDLSGPRGGGKALRPTLCLQVAECLDAPPLRRRSATTCAVSVELLHTFSLIHDDLMDGDAIRRNRPTVWAKYGSPSAVLAGDALIGAAFREVSECRSADTAHLLGGYSKALSELVMGQALDMSFETRDEVSEDEYFRMTKGKTGSLFALAAWAGGTAAGCSPQVTEVLWRYGSRLGTLFQLTDDLLGIVGDPNVTGKSVLSDVARRKKTAPWVGAASQNPQAAQALRKMSIEQPEEIRALILDAGGAEWTRERIRTLGDLVWRECATFALPPPLLPFLFKLCRLAAERES